MLQTVVRHWSATEEETNYLTPQNAKSSLSFSWIKNFTFLTERLSLSVAGCPLWQVKGSVCSGPLLRPPSIHTQSLSRQMFTRVLSWSCFIIISLLAAKMSLVYSPRLLYDQSFLALSVFFLLELYLALSFLTVHCFFSLWFVSWPCVQRKSSTLTTK